MRLALIILMAFFSAFALAKGSKKSRYPLIQVIEGPAVQVEDVLTVVNREPQHSEKEKSVRRGQVLRDKSTLKTGEKGRLRLALNENSALVLDEKTEIRIPEILWKDGGVKEVQLLHGSLRYVCQKDCERKIISPLYENTFQPGDYLIEYDPTVPRVQVSVLSGEAPFTGLGNEKSLVLHAGERAAFVGVIENDQPAFDILLHGRKAAKGNLGDVQKVPADFIEGLKKQDQALIKVAKKAKEPKRQASQICDKPRAELNQCAWICEKNKKGAKDCLLDQGAQCIRMRCNANGEWSDRTELSNTQSPCKAQSFVGTCDY